VLAKHLPRLRVDDAGLDAFAEGMAQSVFTAPPGSQVAATRWTLSPDAVHPRLSWSGESPNVTLVASHGHRELRRWRLLDLEQIFHPARFALTGRRALLVPIERRWADALVEYAVQQRSLTGSSESEKPLLRAENAYYCYPKANGVASEGAPILFYVKEPVGAVIGEARIFEATLDEPEELYLRYGGLGICQLEQIRHHVMRRGHNQGKALALRFGLYVPFPEPVGRVSMLRRSAAISAGDKD
jgi:hypothetical protein